MPQSSMTITEGSFINGSGRWLSVFVGGKASLAAISASLDLVASPSEHTTQRKGCDERGKQGRKSMVRRTLVKPCEKKDDIPFRCHAIELRKGRGEKKDRIKHTFSHLVRECLPDLHLASRTVMAALLQPLIQKSPLGSPVWNNVFCKS